MDRSTIQVDGKAGESFAWDGGHCRDQDRPAPHHRISTEPFAPIDERKPEGAVTDGPIAGAAWALPACHPCARTGVAQADISTGEFGSPARSRTLQPLNLTLKGALAAALNNNPDVLLYKERIREAQGQVQTQLGAMLPNISADIRQTRRTQFLGTIGLSPVRTDPFSIFDTRISATQNLFSLSLIQRWRASRESLRVTEQESEAKRFDTMARVALVYMEGVKAMAMVNMHEANQQVMNELLDIVRQRQRGGVATGLDIARLEAQLAVERQQGSSARYDLEHAKLSLINLLALPVEIRLL